MFEKMKIKISHLLRKTKRVHRFINHHRVIFLVSSILFISGLTLWIILATNIPIATPVVSVEKITEADVSIIEKAVEDKDFIKNEILVKISVGGNNTAKDFANKNSLELIDFNDESKIAKFKAADKNHLVEVIKNNGASYDIEPNWMYETTNTESNPDYSKQWGHKVMDVNYAYTSTKGASVKVAIIDTGIDVNHPEFSGRISPLSYNSCSKTNDLIDIQDKNGHGTHVAGIIGAADNNIGIIGVAPEVEIVAVKAQCPSVTNGSFSDFDLINAINYVAKQKINVLNMSLGSQVKSGLVEQAVADATSNGVIVVAAAGNNASSLPFYPASYNGVISVSALRYDIYDPSSIGRIKPDYSYTNYGDRIDFSAPGTDIYSTYLNGGYKSLSGTSMASPQVAGVVALVLAQNPSFNLTQVKDTIKNNSVDRGDPGKDLYHGWGAVNVGNMFSSDVKTVTLDYRFENKKITFKSVIGEKIDYPNDIYRRTPLPEFWYKDSLLRNKWDFANDTVKEDTTLYLRWYGESDPVLDEFTHLSQDGKNYIFGFDSNAMTYQSVMAKIKRSWAESSKIFRDGSEITTANTKIITGDTIVTTMVNKTTKLETVVLVGDISSTTSPMTGNSADGIINNSDLSMINNMISGILSFEPSNLDLKSADINNDGKIDKDDSVTLQNSIKNNTTVDQKIRSISTSSFKYQEAMIGDVYQDGKVSIADASMIYQYLEGIREFSDFQKYVADTNKDGQIGAIDGKIIQRFLAGTYTSLPVIDARSLYGDANWDGKVDQTDVAKVQRYLNYYNDDPSEYPWYLWYIADVNLDEKITQADLDYISQYVTGVINRLPVLN